MKELASELVDRITTTWCDDPDSSVVWVGDFEGRRGIRMRQTVRDMTTVWFAVGERTVSVEAYVLPRPPRQAEDVYRQALSRNARTRRMAFALDRQGDLVLVGKVPLDALSETELELTLGEIYELIEVSFRALATAAFGREKNA